MLFVLLCIVLSHPCHAAFRTIGGAHVEIFGAPAAHWTGVGVEVDFEADLERVRIKFPDTASGHPLNARLDFKRVPGFGAWVAQRQGQGGTTWVALKAVLDELGDGPCMVLTHEKLPANGPAKFLVGLRRGSRFELYATVPGVISPCGSRLCCQLGEPDFASRSAGLAWRLLKPLALQQAKQGAGR